MNHRFGVAAAVMLGLILGSAGCAESSARRGAASGGVQTAVNPGAGVADQSFLDSFARTFRYRLGSPTAIKITPDARTVLFLRSGPRSFVQDLYEHDIATGRERVLLTADQVLRGEEEVLTAEELARRERARLASRGIASYDLSFDGRLILVPLSGRLFVIDRESGTKRELPADGGFPLDARFSPDATRVACVRDGDLYVIDIAAGTQTRLTTREGDHIEHGAAEFVAQEEMDRREGYWWSPDSQFIAFQRTDTTGVERFNIADPVNPEKKPQTWPYPRAGKTNATVTLHVVPVTGGAPAQVAWDNAAYPYLARVDWAKGGPLTALVQNRTQTEQALLEIEPGTGSIVRELLRERDRAWINLHEGPRWLPDASGFLWHTDAGTDPRIELRSRDGSIVRVLTGDDWFVHELVGYDSAWNAAIVRASERTSRDQGQIPDAGETHIFRVVIDDGRTERLSPEGEASHSAVLAAGGSAWVTTRDRFDAPTRYVIGTRDRASAGELRSVAEEPPMRPNVTFHRVRAGGEELLACVFKPRNFEAGRSYPVILSVYTGPGLQYVTANPRGGLLDQWYADHGFIVVRIDNRGTPGRGREFERAVKGNLIDIPLDDQIAGLRSLARDIPEMDMGRVGVYGWSFGGYFSAMAAMRRPDVFKAGVAGAPVCDWADYDTHYTERFMGLPQENPRGYEASNVLTYCKDLDAALLVIHGTADDNVYFMHSLKMTDALFRNQKHFEFLALPGFTHMVPDPVVTRALYGRIADFFVRELSVRD